MGGPKGLNLKLPLGENRGLTPTPRDMPTSTRASNSNRYAVSTQRGTKQTTNRYQEVDNCGKSPKDDIMEQFSREIDAEELIAI